MRGGEGEIEGGEKGREFSKSEKEQISAIEERN